MRAVINLSVRLYRPIGKPEIGITLSAYIKLLNIPKQICIQKLFFMVSSSSRCKRSAEEKKEV